MSQGDKSPVVRIHSQYLDALNGEDQGDAQTYLENLRKAILIYGIPCSAPNKKCAVRELNLRGKIWKTLLKVSNVDSEQYIELIRRKKCNVYEKIRDDSFRTFASDKNFKEVVPETAIVRVLNSFVHQYGNHQFSYRQGMNAVAACFLYNMPEVDAFFAFSKLITTQLPLYWLPDLLGARAGALLVDECLRAFDPELADFLQRKHQLTAILYAFGHALSLCACIPPFDELQILWDFLLTFGVHLNILAITAQILLLRTELLQSAKPKRILDYRKWPRLRARPIISVTMSLLPLVPADLYHKICYHGIDPDVCSEIVGEPVRITAQ